MGKNFKAGISNGMKKKLFKMNKEFISVSKTDVVDEAKECLS